MLLQNKADLVTLRRQPSVVRGTAHNGTPYRNVTEGTHVRSGDTEDLPHVSYCTHQGVCLFYELSVCLYGQLIWSLKSP